MSHKLAFVLALAALVALLAFGVTSPTVSAQNPPAPDACPTPIKKTWQIKGNCGTTGGTHFLGTTDSQPLVIKTNNVERLRLDTAGNVGIGTNAPSEKLTVRTATAKYGFVQTDGSITVGSWVGTGASSPAGGWYGTKSNHPLHFFVNNGSPRLTISTSGNIGIGTSAPTEKLTVQTATANYGFVQTDGTITVGSWIGTGGGSLPGGWYGTKSNHPLHFFINNGSPRITIGVNGNVGIGTQFPSRMLTVKGPGSTGATDSLWVENQSGVAGLVVHDDLSVTVGKVPGSTASHACYVGSALGYSLAHCSSAAEYVPSIDGGDGFPETADLVSIAPTVSNPFADAHSPFAVQKSVTACDSNLLGFILDPAKGADGEKKNDHYLPLAIFGYFPAKVSMESGYIHRGDPLTSSSKPGYAMKATGACKIIGYALEDATAEGTIQVFAHLSENTAPEVAALRAQVEQLKQANAALDARLRTLELESPTVRAARPGALADVP